MATGLLRRRRAAAFESGSSGWAEPLGCDIVPATQLATGPGWAGRVCASESALSTTLSFLSGPFRALRVWREGAALAPALLALGTLCGTLALFTVLASVEGSWRGWDPAACG